MPAIASKNVRLTLRDSLWNETLGSFDFSLSQFHVYQLLRMSSHIQIVVCSGAFFRAHLLELQQAAF